MPQRFGQASDYSANFAFLAQQNYVRMEDAASRVDRMREEELASEDELAFTRYQEGKMSGEEILSYIRRRISQTGYDKAQQNKWRAALVEYTNNVADETATAEFERTGNVGAFIAHWSSRLSGTKKGSPEYTQIQSVLADLREQRDQKQLTNGANRIMREILKGNKSTKDLINFYKESLNKGGLSTALRSQIKDTLVQLQAKFRQEQYQIAQLKVDEKLASGQITPQEAATQKRGNADKWGITQSDPVAFQQLLGEIRILNATPDPKEVAQAEADLKAGKISARDFAEKMETWADMIAPFDQRAAWELRGDARAIREEYETAQKLNNPYIIGQSDTPGSNVSASRGAMTVNTFIGKRLQHISQLDGTQYSLLNCTMGAAAMMGYTLGEKGLRAGDLRAQSGDTAGGTTLLQAQAALAKNGVDGLRYKDGFSYEKFLTNIKQGSTAIVSGYLGNVNNEFNNAGLRGNHAVYVARYDPQKGFLVLDPALRSSKGYWVSEAQMKKFAWTGSGLGIYSRNGSVLLAPKGTLKTRWNKGQSYDPRSTATPGAARLAAERGKGGDAAANARAYDKMLDIEEGLAFISVHDEAKTEEGKAYQGQYNPGPDMVTPIIDAWNAERVREAYKNPAHMERLRAAGITPGDASLDTREEVIASVNERTQAAGDTRGWIQGFAEVYDGSDGPFLVVNGSRSQMLTREDISRMERELVIQLDGLALLNEAIGNQEGADFARQTINETILISQTVTSTDMNWERGQLFRNIDGILSNSGSSIASTQKALEEVAGVLAEFNANWQEDEVFGPPAPGQEPTEQTQALDQLGQLPDSLTVPTADGKSQTVLIAGEAEALQGIIDAALDPSTEPDLVEDMVLQYAETYDVELPPRWPEPLKPGERSVTGIGKLLTDYVGNANVVWRVNNKQGELVYIKGEPAFVPYVTSGGATAQGNAAEGVATGSVGDIAAQAGVPLPEGVDPNAAMAYGTGMVPQLDLDYIRDFLGIELPQEYTISADALPKAFILVDGNPTAVTVIPEQIAYQDANMLQIRSDDAAQTETYLQRVKDYLKSVGIEAPVGLEEGQMLSKDMLASFPPGVVRQLLQGGESSPLVAQPYLVWTMQLPGQAHPWFMDPETEKWHYNGLPFVTASAPAIPGADTTTTEVTGFIGARYDDTGRAVPDASGWDGEAQGSTAMTTPFGEGVDTATAMTMQMNGEGNANTGLLRDPLDNDVRQQSAEEYQNEYVDIKSAREAADWAITEAKKQAARAWEMAKSWAPSDRAANLGYAPEDMTITPSPWGGQSLADLTMVGATDTRSQDTQQQPGFMPPFKDFFSNLDLKSIIGKGTQALSTMDFSQVPSLKTPYEAPKIEWKPSNIEGYNFNPEFGYSKPGTPSAAESYTPPKPEEPYSVLSGTEKLGR